MAELMFGLSQTKKKKTEEQKVRTTKASLKEVNITDTIEKEVRKEQHDREKSWKQTGRDQIKKNTNFDMARSLFGGGGPAPAAATDESDEDEPVAQQHEPEEEEEVDEEPPAEEEDEEYGEEEYEEEED